MEQARRADRELAQGIWRGPLHGVPWGAKDLLAVRDYPTTWGAAPFKEQLIDEDAPVVQRLDEAGAVVVAQRRLGPPPRGARGLGRGAGGPLSASVAVLAGIPRLANACTAARRGSRVGSQLDTAPQRAPAR